MCLVSSVHFKQCGRHEGAREDVRLCFQRLSAYFMFVCGRVGRRRGPSVRRPSWREREDEGGGLTSQPISFALPNQPSIAAAAAAAVTQSQAAAGDRWAMCTSAFTVFISLFVPSLDRPVLHPIFHQLSVRLYLLYSPCQIFCVNGGLLGSSPRCDLKGREQN